MNNPTETPGSADPASSAPAPKPAGRVIIKQRSKQDWLIALGVAGIVLAFIVFTVVSFSNQVAGLARPGDIVEKIFLPEPETQFSNIVINNQVGKPLEVKEIPGRYILRVKLQANDEMYNVYVDQATYARYEVGDTYMVKVPENGGKDVFQQAQEDLEKRRKRD